MILQDRCCVNGKSQLKLLCNNTTECEWMYCSRLVLPRRSNTHTPVQRPFSATTQVSRYHKGKTNLDFTEAWDSEWQWRQLGHMQVCTSLQTDNHASIPPLSFLQAGCPCCFSTNSIKALNARRSKLIVKHSLQMIIASQIQLSVCCSELYEIATCTQYGDTPVTHI